MLYALLRVPSALAGGQHHALNRAVYEVPPALHTEPSVLDRLVALDRLSPVPDGLVCSLRMVHFVPVGLSSALVAVGHIQTP